MPFASEAQRRLMYATAAGRARKGPSPAVAKQFISHAGGDMPDPKKPGYRYREQEYDTLKAAAEAGSAQARVRLGGASRALERQKALMRTRIGKPRS